MPRLVFISHASPEDNDFVLWLAGRLAAAGYEVWSDLTKLIGGELFWDRIETAIRTETAVFLSVVSRRSVKKRNFLNELSVAISVEVARSVDDFVVPVRTDDLPFGDVPGQLHRKNVIDFHAGWHIGLARILNKLEVLRVPRTNHPASEHLRQWASKHFGFTRGVSNTSEKLSTNWLDCRDMPQSVFAARVPSDVPPRNLFEPLAWPVVKFRDHVISFARTSELAVGRALGPSAEISVDAILSCDARFMQGAVPHAGRVIMSYLLRRAWERYSRSLGLHGFRLAGRRYAWFLPLSGAEIVWIDYQGMSGETRRKRLIGRSESRGVYWHAALEFVPLFHMRYRTGLSMHVVFTKDGVTPLGDPMATHRLRRRFCKNWWQGQWRDLQLAYLAYLSRGGQSISLPVSLDRTLIFDATPMCIDAPVSYTESAKIGMVESDELSEAESDDLDDAEAYLDPMEELVKPF